MSWGFFFVLFFRRSFSHFAAYSHLMANKAIRRNLKIYINGEEVDATITNLRKNLAKFRTQANRAVEGSDKWEKYNNIVAQLELELARATSAQKEFKESVKLSEEGIDSSSNALAKFTGGLSTLISGYKNGDVFEVMAGWKAVKKNIGGATDALLKFVSTPTGAIIAFVVGIGAAAKEFINYNKGIAKAVKLTQQLTGFNGQELQDFRASVQATAEVYDKEFNEVLRSANALSKQMKISQQEALELINEGFVRGADSSGDFLNKLQEYPVQFKNAGFSAQDFIDIATQEVKGGVYDDKLLDTIKEADLALKEFTKSTEDALINAFGPEFAQKIKTGVATGKVSTKQAIDDIISEADRLGLNFQQKEQLIADVFKGAGEDAGGFGEIILQLNEAFNEQNKILSEVEQAELRLVDATTENEKALADLFDASQSGFPEMLSNLKAIGLEIYTNVLVGLKSMFTTIEQLKKQAGIDGQANAIKRVSENIKEFGTTAAEEAAIQVEAAKKNIARISKEIEDLPFYKRQRGNKKILEKQLAEQQAYLKELQAIAREESQAFLNYQKSLKTEPEISNTGDTRTEAQKKADELAAKQAAKAAAQRLKEHEKLMLEIAKLEEEAYLVKLDLDEREIQEIKNKFAKLLKLAEAGSKEEAKLLLLQQQEIDAKKLEQEERFQKEKEKVRKQYDLLSSEEKKAEELNSLKELYDRKLLSEEQYQLAKKGIEDAYRLQKLEEETLRKEELEAKREEEFQKQLERDDLTDRERFSLELERLKELLDAKLIQQEDYEAKVAQLRNRRLLEQVQKAKQAFAVVGNIVEAAKNGELASIEEVTKRKGESEEEFVKRKEEAEEKKKAINKKYALAELLITIGKTAANTALAIIRAYSDLGPIAGTVAAALVGTVGALQINNARKEYKRVKSFSRGGDTGTGNLGLGRNSGGYIRGVVEEDEYVVPKFVRNMPGVPRIVEYLEARRTGKTDSFAEGGDTSSPIDEGLPATGDTLLVQLIQKLLDRLNAPLKINFTLNDLISLQELEQKLTNTINESKGN